MSHKQIRQPTETQTHAPRTRMHRCREKVGQSRTHNHRLKKPTRPQTHTQIHPSPKNARNARSKSKKSTKPSRKRFSQWKIGNQSLRHCFRVGKQTTRNSLITDANMRNLLRNWKRSTLAGKNWVCWRSIRQAGMRDIAQGAFPPFANDQQGAHHLTTVTSYTAKSIIARTTVRLFALARNCALCACCGITPSDAAHSSWQATSERASRGATILNATIGDGFHTSTTYTTSI